MEENTTNSTSANREDPEGGAWVDLQNYRVTNYDPGGVLPRALWLMVSALLFESALPLPSGLKCQILRWFGAKIGQGVVVKPRVRIKYPWFLEIGDFTWLGEDSWLDNLAEIKIGSHVCISQGVYFCTGSHDRKRTSFDLITSAIEVGDGAWIAARSTLLGGVKVGENALVAACSLVNQDVPAAMIVGGNPATTIRQRERPV